MKNNGIVAVLKRIEAAGFKVASEEGWIRFGVGQWIIEAPDGRVAIRRTDELETVARNEDNWVRA